MCKCTPNKRTPFCGAPGCEWPRPERPIFGQPHQSEIDAVARSYYETIFDGSRWDDVPEADIAKALHRMAATLAIARLDAVRGQARRPRDLVHRGAGEMSFKG